MSNFEKWDKEFRAQNLYAFNNNANALLWLKVRAVCRGKQIDQFLRDNKLTLKGTKISEQNVELFELLENCKDAKDMLNKYLRDKNNEWTRTTLWTNILSADMLRLLANTMNWSASRARLPTMLGITCRTAGTTIGHPISSNRYLSVTRK